MPDRFFHERQGAAVLKHHILGGYLPVFISKTGSASPSGKVGYLDGYAGPGSYEDESPGSPALAIQAVEPLAAIRELQCVFIEEDPATTRALVEFLQQAGIDNASVLHGACEEYLDEVLLELKRLPLLAFFDPFGMGLPFNRIRSVLQRPGTRPTEVLLNFSLPGLRRNAGHLTSDSQDPTYLKARQTILDKLDDYLGGPWWREVWRSCAEDREDQILSRYARLLSKGGWGWVAVPVSDRWEGPPSYYLLFFTSHPDGAWFFGERLSMAFERFYDWYWEGQSQQPLETWESRAAAWIDEIEANLRTGISNGSTFTISQRLVDVFGDAYGYAREKHLRKALKRLEVSGIIEGPVKGKMQHFRVKPRGSAT